MVQTKIEKNNLRFAVVGVGGVGGFLGAHLAEAGLDITFVARSNFETLRTSGLVVQTVERKIILPKVKAVSSVSELADVDYILVTTKAYDIVGFAERLPSSLMSTAKVVTFQNGIDNDLRIKNKFPNADVFPGIAYIITAKNEGGFITQTAGPRKFIVGTRDSREAELLSPLVLVMKDAGLDTFLSDTIEKDLWTKYAWILAFAGVTALTRRPVGEIVNDPIGIQCFEDLLDETIAVANAMKIPLGDSEKKAAMDKAIAYKTVGVNSKSSMAVDIDRGNPTELEALHGTIVKIAARMGISTPALNTTYTALHIGYEALRG
jgi:2-dehydropantoate 2-reductase